MTEKITVTHIKDVSIERMEKKDGWAISEFRLPITGAQGSSTAVFHSIFRSGSTHSKHLHSECDEIAIYLKGHGVVGQSNSRANVNAGHCRLMPRGSEHFFYNEAKEEAEVIGFYIGASSVPNTGYKFIGEACAEDLNSPRGGLKEGILIRIEESLKIIEANNPWKSEEIRVPIGNHNGSKNALINVCISSGIRGDSYFSDNCEQIYYVSNGNGLVGSGNFQEEVSRGTFVYVPRSTPHWIENLDEENELEIYNVLTGAGSLEEANFSTTNE